MRALLAALTAVLLVFLGVPGFGLGTAGAANPAADLDQCANGPTSAPTTTCEWINGNLGSSKAHYLEGDSVAYRLRFSDLTVAATQTVTIEWDTTKSAKHALDYVTTYNRTVTGADPTLDVAGLPAPTTFPIPVDPMVSSAGVTQIAGLFTMWGGTISGVSAYGHSGTWTGDSSARITISFTPTVANPVLAWGGHISTRQDWGQDNSAVAIPGSPYHTRLIDLNGAGGNQDRSLSNDAVIFPASVTITKDAVPASETSFPFTATPAPLAPTFALVDDGDPAVPVASVTYSGITNFTTYIVTEGTVAGWTLSGLACTDTSGDSTASVETRTATLAVAEADVVSCTFTNTRNASITVTKTADPTTVAEPGGPVEFDVVVRNDSEVVSVTIASLTDTVYGNVTTTSQLVTATTCTLPQTIPAGGSYSCSFTGLVAGDAGSVHTNVITASGTDALGNPVSDSDDATVTVTDVMPQINVVKTPSATIVRVGETVTYTYKVTNPGPEPLVSVTITDDKCSPVTFVDGDTDGDTALDSSETWTYTCKATLAATTVNVVTVIGSDDEANKATDTDTAKVAVVDARIAIDKTASAATAAPGDVVTYSYVVTNPGNDPITSVALSDDRCSPVVYQSGDTDADLSLDPGETWKYTCAMAMPNVDDLVINVVSVTGVDSLGATVGASDNARVDVQPAEVLGVVLARTGTRVLWYVGLGLVLVVAGALFVFASRRRVAR